MTDIELFDIYAGTYEEYLIGFSLKKNGLTHKLEHNVADHSHKASIRCISSRGSLLATGSADEVIHLYNTDDKRETGILSQNSGTVTCIALTGDGKHLLSCSEDGSIIVFRVGSWMVEKVWKKAHQGSAVNWIGVHPSNKLALSVGNDGKVRTWNLMKGTAAFATDVSKRCQRPELIIWSPSGETYTLVCGSSVEIFKIADASLLHIIRKSSKITCAIYLTDDILVIGDSDGDMEGHEISSGKKLWHHSTGDIRIKAIAAHENHLVTATSQGIISVFEWTKESVKNICSHDSSCRITCLTISCKCHRTEQLKKKKKKKKGKEIDIKEEKVNSEESSSGDEGKPKRSHKISFSTGGSWTIEDVT